MHSYPEATARPTWTAFVACLVAFTALFLTSHGPMLLLMALVLVLMQLAPGAGLPRFEHKTWPIWLARVVALGLAIVTTPRDPNPGFDGILDPRATSIGGQYAAAELLIRLWTREENGFTRYRWIVILSGLVFIAACNTAQPGYIRFLAPLYLLGIVWTLIDFNRTDRGAVRGPSQLLRIAAVLIAFLGGAVLAFVLGTYRNELTAWSNKILLSKSPGAIGGPAANPEMRSSFNSELSPVRVLRIEGLPGVTHLRGATYDSYLEGRWSPGLFNQKFRSATDRELGSGAKGERARFVRFADELNLLYLPANAAGVADAESANLRWSPENGGAVQGQGGVLMPFTYEVVKGRGDGFQGPLRRPLQAPDRRRYLQLPENFAPGIRAIARSIGEGITEPRARVDAVQRYLQKHHRYSLLFHSRGDDPVADFLARKAAAHCQYFAASTVLLLRCLGVPARYVNGYYAHESGGEGVTIVRQRDAHAWAEVWIDGEGWTTVDATPGDGRPDSLAQNVPSWMREWERMQDGIMGFSRRLGGLGMMGWVWLIGGLTAVYVLLRSWRDLFQPRKRGAKAQGYVGPGGELDGVAQRFEGLLKQRGIPCPPHRTWEEHLEQVKAATEPAALDLSRAGSFLADYNAVRFGKPEDAESVSRLLEQVRDLEKC
jgi:transglutaminase-like putative cysteine protease